MANIDNYKNAFVECLEIPVEDVEKATMNEIEKWDSIGQMSLVAVIEDTFGFEFEPEETMAFTSYQAGLEILRKHNIEI